RYWSGLLRGEEWRRSRCPQARRVVVALAAGEQLAAEADARAGRAAGAVQVLQAGPVEHRQLVASQAVEGHRGEHEPGPTVTVVELARVGRHGGDHADPARDAGLEELVVTGTGAVRC